MVSMTLFLYLKIIYMKADVQAIEYWPGLTYVATKGIFDCSAVLPFFKTRESSSPTLPKTTGTLEPHYSDKETFDIQI